jgi:hypothetical protein
MDYKNLYGLYGLFTLWQLGRRTYVLQRLHFEPQELAQIPLLWAILCAKSRVQVFQLER